MHMSFLRNKSVKVLLLSTSSILLFNCGGGSDSTAQDADIAAVPSQPSISLLDVSLSKKPTTESYKPYAEFEFNAGDGVSYFCNMGGAGFIACDSPVTYMPLAVGEHTFVVKAVDAAGAEGNDTVYTWAINSVLQPAAQALNHADLVSTDTQPEQVALNSWLGIFRINCDFSHASYNDPIVFPGEEGAAHLHRFYGNTLVDHNTTNESLFTTGESSCQGNVLNLSGYWMPSVLAPAYDGATDERLVDANGDPAWQVVEGVVGDADESHELFYYAAGVADLQSIQPIPLGLRMIAGSHLSQPGQEQDTSIVRWHCKSWVADDFQNPNYSASIPQCVERDLVRLDIIFPSCWDGTNLDSYDHKSHMAYPVTTAGRNTARCPESHPVPIVRPSYHFAFRVTPEVYDPYTQTSANWKLASDSYEVSQNSDGGMSLHADWINAWQPEVMQMLLDNCIKQQLDCHDGNLANGFRLSDTRPGSQAEPEIINDGRG